jgi:hypothetical protein
MASASAQHRGVARNRGRSLAHLRTRHMQTAAAEGRGHSRGVRRDRVSKEGRITPTEYSYDPGRHAKRLHSRQTVSESPLLRKTAATESVAPFSRGARKFQRSEEMERKRPRRPPFPSSAPLRSQAPKQNVNDKSFIGRWQDRGHGVAGKNHDRQRSVEYVTTRSS